MQCVTPAMLAEGGVVAVALSLNGGADFTDSGVTFAFPRSPSASRSRLRTPPTTGGTASRCAGAAPRRVGGRRPAGAVPLRQRDRRRGRGGRGLRALRRPCAREPGVGRARGLAEPVRRHRAGQRASRTGALHVLRPVEPSWGPVLGGTLVRVLGGRFREDADGSHGAFDAAALGGDLGAPGSRRRCAAASVTRRSFPARWLERWSELRRRRRRHHRRGAIAARCSRTVARARSAGRAHDGRSVRRRSAP